LTGAGDRLGDRIAVLVGQLSEQPGRIPLQGLRPLWTPEVHLEAPQKFSQFRQLVRTRMHVRWVSSFGREGYHVRGGTNKTVLGAWEKRALLLVWDNASWHKGQEVRTWLRAHNRQVKQSGRGVRLVACRLPSKSPWLNPIESKWVHDKRAVAEPTRVLT